MESGTIGMGENSSSLGMEHMTMNLDYEFVFELEIKYIKKGFDGIRRHHK